jgi:hypothetical protein
MKFSPLLPKLLLFPLLVSTSGLPTSTVTMTYDPIYDDPYLDLLKTACSDGPNGLVTQGYRTAGQLAAWPRIGGTFTVEGWNSRSCGKCYRLGYDGRETWVLAVDHADQGVNVAKQVMDFLTGGQAERLGRVQVTFQEESNGTHCGIRGGGRIPNWQRKV